MLKLGRKLNDRQADYILNRFDVATSHPYVYGVVTRQIGTTKTFLRWLEMQGIDSKILDNMKKRYAGCY